MPSTYTLNNGIELIGTGEQSGTWGDTTNTNLSLLDTALDGQVTITLASAGSSGSPNDLPISDGTASNGRNRMIIFNDGGDLGATAYVQLTPNDAEKIIYVRNDLSGSRSIILFQGTYNASNDYELPAGTTAVIFFDGAGSGAVAANVFNNAYFDSLRLGSVSVDKILDEDNMASDDASALATQQSIKAYVDAQVGANNELSEILANGNTSGGTAIQMTTTDELQFRDTALKISSSADGQLDIDADTEIEIVAPTVDIDASTAMTIDTATLTVTGAVDLNTSLNVDGTITSDGLTVDKTATISTTDYYASSTFSGVLKGAATNTKAALLLNSISSSGQNAFASIHSEPIADFRASLIGTYSADGSGAGHFSIKQFVPTSSSTLERLRVDQIGDITFYDADGNASFVYDESAGSTFNENGDNKDFRVESDTNTHALFVDAGNSRVAVGTSSVSDDFTVRNRFNVSENDGGSEVTLAGVTNRSASLFFKEGSTQRGRITGVSGSNTLTFQAGTSERLRMNDTEVVFNDASADIDFRVESDNTAYMLAVDASQDAVTINGSTVATDGSNNYPLSVRANTAADAIAVVGRTSDDIGELGFYESDGTTQLGNIQARPGENGMRFRSLPTSATMQFDLSDSNGVLQNRMLFQEAELCINDTGDDYDFRVESDTNAHALFVDAGNSRIGFFNATPSAPLHLIAGSSGGSLSDAFQISDSSYVNIAMYSGGADGEIRVGAAGTLRGSYKAQYAGTRSAHDFHIGSNSTNMISFDGGGSAVIVNEDGANRDFRVESDSNTHMLFVDASNDAVGIGVSDVADARVNIRSTGVDGSYDNVLSFQYSGNSNETNIIASTISSIPVNSGIYFGISDGGGLTTRKNMLEVTRGAIIVNNDSQDADLIVESNDQTHMLFVDASANSIGIRKSSPDSSYVIDSSGATRFEDGTMTLRNTGEAGPHTYRSGDSGNDFRFFSTNGTFSSPTAKNNGSAVGQIHWSGYDGTQYKQCASIAVTVDGSVSTGTVPMRMTFHAGTTTNTERMRLHSTGELSMSGQTGGDQYKNGTLTVRAVGNDDTGWQNSAISTHGSFGGGISLIDATPPTTSSKGYTLYTADNGNDFYIQHNANSTSSSGGVYLDNAATSWSSASDERDKENLVNITGAVDNLKTLRTVKGNYIESPNNTRAFLIAQDVNAFLPEAVSIRNKFANTEDQRYGLDYQQLIPVLVAAIKEQQSTIDSLETRIAALENA